MEFSFLNVQLSTFFNALLYSDLMILHMLRGPSILKFEEVFNVTKCLSEHPMLLHDMPAVSICRFGDVPAC